MTIPPRSGRWIKKSAQPPAGLEHYDFEGPHALATPSRIGPWHELDDYEEDHSPEAEEARRDQDKVDNELHETRENLRAEFKGDADSWYDDTPAQRAKIKNINRTFERNPELDGLTRAYVDTSREPEHQAWIRMNKWVETSLPRTGCPKCAAHLLGNVLDKSEEGYYDYGYAQNLLNDVVKPYDVWEDTKGLLTHSPMERRRNITPEIARQDQIEFTRFETQKCREMLQHVRSIADFVRSLRGNALCPLHSAK